MEDQDQVQEDQGLEMAEGRRSSQRLKDKPRVDYNEVNLARAREDEDS